MKIQRYKCTAEGGQQAGILFMPNHRGKWVKHEDAESQHASLLANVGELIDAITAEGGWGERVMDAMVVISPDRFIEQEREA